MRPEPRSALSRIEPYVPGSSGKGKNVDLIKLSSNENPLGVSARVQEAITRELAQAHVYPDGSGAVLREALADRLGVSPDHIILGCGSDEVIRLLAEGYLDPGDGCLFAETSFSQYAFAARIMDAREIVVPLNDGVHDLERMGEMMEQKKPRLAFVCNPNNPTGTYVGRDALERFLDRAPAETLVVIDEAYFEYATADDFPDGVEYVKQGRNVVSLRTFSKIHALAGLRVGYGVAPVEVVEALNRIRPPFNVNRLAQAAALAALADDEHLRQSQTVNAKERNRLTEAMGAMGLRVLPSQANFLFVELDVEGSAVFQALAEKGIFVREGAPFGRPRAIRVTVGTPEQNERFLEALQSALARIRERGTQAQ